MHVKKITPPKETMVDAIPAAIGVLQSPSCKPIDANSDRLPRKSIDANSEPCKPTDANADRFQWTVFFAWESQQARNQGWEVTVPANVEDSRGAWHARKNKDVYSHRAVSD